MASKILSCDGGGIRGLITALLIQDLSTKFGLIAKADGFAGTSTGGLIALGLAAGREISDLVDIYRNDGEKIFEKNGWLLAEEQLRGPPPLSPEELTSGSGIFSCQYKNDGLKKIAAQLLGDLQFKHIEKLLVVNSAQLCSGTTWVPAALSNSVGGDYTTVFLRDAALATSAAPTYFPPYEIGTLGYFADGGTYANDPAMTAIGEAMAGGKTNSLDELAVLSSGTGISPQGTPPEAIKKPLDKGVTHWLWPTSYNGGKVPATALLNLTLDLTAQLASVQAAQILNSSYCRGNVLLQNPIGLDDYKAVKELEAVTQAYMRTADWQRVCTWVDQNWS